jgi:hypothetical protein
VGALGAVPALADEAPTTTPSVTASSTTTVSTTTGPTASSHVASPAPTTTVAPPTTTPAPSSTASATPRAAAAGDPSASIGAFDCAALTVPVTLDNVQSTTATTFVLTTTVPAGPTLRKEEVVQGGSSVETRADLVDNAYNEVVVALSDGTTLTSVRPAFCGEKPRATIGAFDCSALQAPVTLDNSTGSAPFFFDAQWFFSNTDFDQSESYTVAAGAVREVTVPLVDNAWTSIWVREGFNLPPTPVNQELLATTRGLCGLEPGAARVTAGSVDCAAKTIGVTIDNRQTPPRRPRSTTFAVSTSYAGTVAFTRYLDEAREVYGLTVPVKLRPDGRLTVTGSVPGATPPREVLYSEPLAIRCAAPTGSTTSPPATQATSPGVPAATTEQQAAEQQLSATGAREIPTLLLAAGLLTSGLLLIRVAGRRREH